MIKLSLVIDSAIAGSAAPLGAMLFEAGLRSFAGGNALAGWFIGGVMGAVWAVGASSVLAVWDELVAGGA